MDIVQRHWVASGRFAPTEGDVVVPVEDNPDNVKLTSLLILDARHASRSGEERRR